MEPLYTTTALVSQLICFVALLAILGRKLLTAWREHGKDRILDFKALGLKR